MKDQSEDVTMSLSDSSLVFARSRCFMSMLLKRPPARGSRLGTSLWDSDLRSLS